MSNSANRFLTTLPLPLRSPVSLALPLALPLSLVPQATTLAVSFNFDFERTVPEQLQLATKEAADLWSPLLKDDVVVRLRVNYLDLSAAGSVLAGAQPGKVKVKYEDYADALFKDATSSNDFLGVNNLQLSAKGREAIQKFQTGDRDLEDTELESKEFSFLMDGLFAKGRDAQPDWQNSRSDFLDNNGNDNNKHIQITRAQAKSLGLLENKADKLDAVITINSNASWDFDRRNGVDTDRYDAVTVLQHEIGHALGVVSGTDTLDFLAAVGDSDSIEDVEKSRFSYLTPIDFYRYSEESAQLGVMDLTIGGSEKYFSLDGGESAVTDESGQAAYFSIGGLDSGGDGYQGSHWRASDAPLGVMNPVLQPGESIDISELDLTLLDTTGWDLEDATAERAAAVGVDWLSMTERLARDRQVVIDDLKAVWGDDIPKLEAAINDASFQLEFDFQQKLKEKLQDLTDKLEKETEFEKRSEELIKFYEKVDKEADKREEKLRELPEDIYKTDETIREWLTLPTEKLSDKMKEADAATINRLSNVVKALPADEQAAAELKIEDAVARFVDKPDKLVQELLETSGPANPIGWSYFRWYWWWMEGKGLESDLDDGDFDDDFEDLSEDFSMANSTFYYYQSAAIDTAANNEERSTLPLFNSSDSSPLTSFDRNSSSTQEVPEPSSALALFGIAVLGAKHLRSRTTDKGAYDKGA